jgi:hypothetical protein
LLFYKGVFRHDSDLGIEEPLPKCVTNILTIQYHLDSSACITLKVIKVLILNASGGNLFRLVCKACLIRRKRETYPKPVLLIPPP